jgi:hypothetical protein
VAPPGTNRPGCARSRQGTEFPESRFRASRVTFVRRQRPYRRSPRSRSRGYCSARAKRSSHRCRDKRCSVSSGPGARSALTRVAARPREREPGALAGRRGSGRQQAHRRLPQSRRSRAAGVADHDAGPSMTWRCAPLARSASSTDRGRETCNCPSAVLGRRPRLKSRTFPCAPASAHHSRSRRWLARQSGR